MLWQHGNHLMKGRRRVATLTLTIQSYAELQRVKVTVVSQNAIPKETRHKSEFTRGTITLAN